MQSHGAAKTAIQQLANISREVQMLKRTVVQLEQQLQQQQPLATVGSLAALPPSIPTAPADGTDVKEVTMVKGRIESLEISLQVCIAARDFRKADELQQKIHALEGAIDKWQTCLSSSSQLYLSIEDLADLLQQSNDLDSQI